MSFCCSSLVSNHKVCQFYIQVVSLKVNGCVYNVLVERFLGKYFSHNCL